jgi:hypothetical protein
VTVSEGAHHIQDGAELRMSVGRQRLVQTLAPDAGALSDLRHAFGAGHDDQGVVDQRRLAVAAMSSAVSR